MGDHIYIAARPSNGYLIHAIRADAIDHPVGGAMGRIEVHARALCGVRGIDGWGFGGMHPLPGREAPSLFHADIPGACPKCIRRIARGDS